MMKTSKHLPTLLIQILQLESWDIEMTGNSELMNVIKNNVDNHHAKISDALYKKWIELNQNKRIESKESAFHLSVVIDLKTQIAEYFENSNLAISWQSTSEEDQNGICSILLMDFLIELAHAFHSKFRRKWQHTNNAIFGKIVT